VLVGLLEIEVGVRDLAVAPRPLLVPRALDPLQQIVGAGHAELDGDRLDVHGGDVLDPVVAGAERIVGHAAAYEAAFDRLQERGRLVPVDGELEVAGRVTAARDGGVGESAHGRLKGNAPFYDRGRTSIPWHEDRGPRCFDAAAKAARTHMST